MMRKMIPIHMYLKWGRNCDLVAKMSLSLLVTFKVSHLGEYWSDCCLRLSFLREQESKISPLQVLDSRFRGNDKKEGYGIYGQTLSGRTKLS